MSKLEIKENKKLTLKSVVICELRNIEIQELDTKINQFIQNLQLYHAQSFGPLVTKFVGTQISEAGEMTFDYDLMMQVHNYELFDKQYRIASQISAPHCLYVHFDGLPQDAGYATNKIDLHAYENDYQLTGEIYSIVLKSSVDQLVVDYFKPRIYETL